MGIALSLLVNNSQRLHSRGSSPERASLTDLRRMSISLYRGSTPMALSSVSRQPAALKASCPLSHFGLDTDLMVVIPYVRRSSFDGLSTPAGGGPPVGRLLRPGRRGRECCSLNPYGNGLDFLATPVKVGRRIGIGKGEHQWHCAGNTLVLIGFSLSLTH